MARFTHRCVLTITASFVGLLSVGCHSAQIDPAELDHYTNADTTNASSTPMKSTPWRGADSNPPFDSASDSAGSLSSTAVRTVRLKRGESLYGLSQKYLGSGKRWREIAELNGLSDSQVRRLAVGREIRIPSR